MNLLDWLGQLVEWFVRLLPRPYILRSTHGAVAFVRGKPRQWEPGTFHFYWPLWTEVEKWPLVEQPIELPAQTFMREGKVVAVRAVAIVEVFDWMTLLTSVYDPDVLMGSRLLELVKRTVIRCGPESGVLNAELLRAAKDMLSPYGVYVKKLLIVEAPEAIAVSLLDKEITLNVRGIGD